MAHAKGEFLDKNVLEEVQKTEAEAQAILHEADLKKQQLLAEGRKEAERILAESAERLTKSQSAELESKRKELEKSTRRILADADKEVKELEERVQGSRPAATKRVLEHLGALAEAR